MVSFRPWLRASGSALGPGWLRAWLARLRNSPFVLGFLILAWPIFLLLVRASGRIPKGVQDHIGFIPSQWDHNVFGGILVSHVGLIVQHSWGQIVYISLLLLTVGVLYESKQGTLRTLLVFYGASAVGVATLVLFVVAAPLNGGSAWSYAMAHTSWSGASVGAFGLMGAYFATRDRPWIFVAGWVFYEAALEWMIVPSLAVVMHVTGFTFGFLASRLAWSLERPFAARAPEAVEAEA